MLGLTLAELLLLLLFLFLLIATSLLFNRDKKYEDLQKTFRGSEVERAAFRSALGDALGLSQYGNRLLTKAELEAPLASIRELAQQKDDLEDQLSAAHSELGDARKSMPNAARQASALREQNDALKRMLARAKADLQTYNGFKSRAAVIAPNKSPPQTIAAALNDLADKQNKKPQKGDTLGQCKAELNNANARTAQAEARCHPGRAGDYPSCVYRNDGRAAYVYEVSLTEQGALVRTGDTGDFEQIPWVSALPKLPMDRALSPGEFITSSAPFRVAGDQQAPACRFYIRVQDNMGSASREEFKRLYLSVQSNFYHHLER